MNYSRSGIESKEQKNNGPVTGAAGAEARRPGSTQRLLGPENHFSN